MREAEPIPVRMPADIEAPPRGPARRRPLAPSDYPSSDGKPMAETPIHRHAMNNVTLPLEEFYRDRPDVYVGCNMLMYYREGDRKRSVAPDVFVAFGVPKLPERDTWLVWLEGKGPDFVLEVTSKHTRNVDEGRKRHLYAELGVREYWQFDPTGDYLDPVLKGSRLENGRYRELVLEKRGGSLRHITVLGLEFRLEGDRLRLFDPKQRQYLKTHRESMRANKVTENALQTSEAERDDFRNAWQTSEAERVKIGVERDDFRNAWQASEAAHGETRNALQASEAAHGETKNALQTSEAERATIETERDDFRNAWRTSETERARAEARIRELERRLGDD